MRALRLVVAMILLATVASRARKTHAGTLVQQAPAKAAARQNPYENEDTAKQAGSKLYQRHCASCHGQDAAGRDRAPALTSPDVRNAPPGVLFWILRHGSLRHGMPSFSQLPEQQRWQIVTYLKTL